jgi:hypothetical protein
MAWRERRVAESGPEGRLTKSAGFSKNPHRHVGTVAIGPGLGRLADWRLGSYNPADLLKLYVYGYLNRVSSRRRLERECARNTEVMWRLRRLRPDFKTIADLRRDNAVALRAACSAFVQFCRRGGLLGGKRVGIDGSKFKAAASRDSVMTRAQLTRDRAEIEKRIAQYLAQLDQADEHNEDGAGRAACTRGRDARGAGRCGLRQRRASAALRGQRHDGDGAAPGDRRGARCARSAHPAAGAP